MKSPEDMEGLLNLPYWVLKPYVRPKPDENRAVRKRRGETLEQNKQKKMHKAKRVAKFHEKVLNQVLKKTLLKSKI